MRNVSSAFLSVMKKRRDFYMTADAKFSDGKKTTITRENLYMSGNSYTESANSSSFPIGTALGRQVTMSIVNDADQWAEYDFYGAEFTVYCCLDLDDGSTEKILLGTYTVVEPESYGSIIELTAVDGMYLGDKAYATGLSYPLTVQEALIDSCNTCGVTLLSSTFTNSDYIISSMPEGLTHRTLWGLCAMLAGGNARMDEYNRLCIVGYDFQAFLKEDAEEKIYKISNAKNLTVSTDDVVVTGLDIEVDGVGYQYGQSGYVISLSNQLLNGAPQDALNRIGELIVGARFRLFEADVPAFPIMEFGDACYLEDRKNNVYQSIVTDIDFTFYGFTTLKCSADSPLRNSSAYYSKTTEASAQNRLYTKKELSNYDKTVQSLTSLITQSFGAYKTEEVQSDGSTIYYMHDKPTLAGSKSIWKMSANVFSVSDDGGKTWKAGIDSSGNAVMNVVNVVGLNADYINTGTLIARDSKGNIVLSVNVETGEVSINAEAIKMSAGSLEDYAENNDAKVSEIESKAGQVSVIAKDEQGTLSSVINTEKWEIKYVDANGAEISGLTFDPENKRFLFNGSGNFTGSINVADKFIVDVFGNARIYGGRYYAMDEDGNISSFTSMDKDGFTVYSADSIPVIKIGFPDGNLSYPYVRLTSGEKSDEQSGIVKKFANGLWLGNDAPADGYGTFYPQEGYNGIFISFEDGKTYVVSGTDMQNVYTGESIARFG